MQIYNRLGVYLYHLKLTVFLFKELCKNPCTGSYFKNRKVGAYINSAGYRLSDTHIPQEVLA